VLKANELKGFMPANVLPFTENFDIDEKALQNFIRYLLGVKNVNGIICNGHAGEVATLTLEERIKVIELIVKEVKGNIPLIAGIYSESTREAILSAKQAEKAGSDGILVLPPLAWYRGKAKDAPYHFFKAIADAISIPILIFQYPANCSASYSLDVLSQLVGIDKVIGIKDASRDWVAYDADYRFIKSFKKEISFFSANNSTLFPSFTIGADGAIVGSGSLVPDLIGEMFTEVKSGNLSKARQIHERITPIMEVFYQNPSCNVYTRIKEAQVLMGRLKNSVVRPPLLPISESEYKQIKEVLHKADLL